MAHVNLKYLGSFDELKEKLDPLNGHWDEDQPNKKVLHVEAGILNWFETTGTISFQGKNPGREALEQTVPNLLYPSEYKKIETISDVNQKPFENVIGPATQFESLEQSYLAGSFNETEMVFGIVNAVGTEYKRVLDPLKDRLQGFGYVVTEIRVSELLPLPGSTLEEYDRIKHYMKEGDEFRRRTGNNAILAAGAIDAIARKRNESPKKVAYIINSLKHPDEVEFLRKVYGNGFYLFGIHADEKRRRNFLVSDKSLTQQQADLLISIDEDEKIPHGQRTRDTFHLSDFYISLGRNDDQVKHTLQRFLELLFSNPFRNPTFDEFAMFMAFNSSIRSSDLSRQVGAVISRNNQILSTGANDTPRYGGGQYWAEVDMTSGEVNDLSGGKDYTRGEDSNKVAQYEIIGEILNALQEKWISNLEQRADIEKILKKSKIADLTEFGRVVHAEMEAILSCAREGISTLDATLYCTTFPCHNCAKHIVDAGINRVVYVEPYPKSRALELYSDSIELVTSLDTKPSNYRVKFEPFTGVGARRFLDLFSLSLGDGSKVRRKSKDGHILDWDKKTAVARTPLLPKSYLEIEKAASDIWLKLKS